MDYREQPEDNDKLEDDLPEPEEIPVDDEEGFIDPEAENAADNDVNEAPPKAKKSAPKNNHNPRRSVEDYLERKRLRDEIGSVFEEDDEHLEKDLGEGDDDNK